MRIIKVKLVFSYADDAGDPVDVTAIDWKATPDERDLLAFSLSHDRPYTRTEVTNGGITATVNVPDGTLTTNFSMTRKAPV